MFAEEHRHHHRKHLALYLDIIDQRTGRLLGHLSDISIHGFMFVSQKAFAINERRTILLKLPDNEELWIDAKDLVYPLPETILHFLVQRVIEAEIEIRWINQHASLNCVGCEFRNISEQALLLIQHLVEHIGFDASVMVKMQPVASTPA